MRLVVLNPLYVVSIQAILLEGDLARRRCCVRVGRQFAPVIASRSACDCAATLLIGAGRANIRCRAWQLDKQEQRMRYRIVNVRCSLAKRRSSPCCKPRQPHVPVRLCQRCIVSPTALK